MRVSTAVSLFANADDQLAICRFFVHRFARRHGDAFDLKVRRANGFADLFAQCN
ncbi:hypothetical protein D3C81_1044340 [compost metagenome]